jgi:starvation-inducible outer membrane lipoprotein
MKTKVILFAGVLLSACSSVPTYEVKGYAGPEVMHRNEVIQASRDCLRAKLRPSVEYVAQKVNTGGKVLVAVDVRCDPY